MQKELELFDKQSFSSFEIDEKYQTPIEVIQYMVSLLGENVKTVFEPTPGKGGIVSVLRNKGYHVAYADDFFSYPKDRKFDAIVMNPPFSSKSAYTENAPAGLDLKGMKVGYHILFECMKMTNTVIALMPWYTISDSDVRMRQLEKYGLKSLTLLPRKTFEYARIQTVVIELQRGYSDRAGFNVFKY
jgi:hypothetical protein